MHAAGSIICDVCALDAADSNGTTATSQISLTADHGNIGSSGTGVIEATEGSQISLNAPNGSAYVQTNSNAIVYLTTSSVHGSLEVTAFSDLANNGTIAATTGHLSLQSTDGNISLSGAGIVNTLFAGGNISLLTGASTLPSLYTCDCKF